MGALVGLGPLDAVVLGLLGTAFGCFGGAEELALVVFLRMRPLEDVVWVGFGAVLALSSAALR